MNLLELVIIAHRCRSTHHFIAFDALQLLAGEDAGDWKNLLLKHHTNLLKGAKAPDTDFKDFQNHVLHVEDGEWGGARDAAMQWYGKAVEALREKKWGKAAYALGVLTHYYADPIQPFHTAQSEEEGAIHRALEWSIAKSRDTIKALIDVRGYPHVHAGTETGFVADMVLAGAKYSNPHYQTFIDHYDLHKGVANPPEGLDQTLLDILADLVAYATAGVAVLFERAFAESGVKPQKVDLDLPGYFAALDIPIRRITKRMADARDRKQVEAMYEEFVETGKVVKTLPADDKKIRALHCKQILRQPVEWLDMMPIRPIGTKHVPLPEHPKPVEYQLRVVPVPVDGGEIETARTPTVSPDPEVFDAEETAPAIVDEPIIEAEPEIEAEEDPIVETAEIIELETRNPEPEIVDEPVVETEPVADTEEATAADAMLAELEAVEDPEPVQETVAETPIETAPETDQSDTDDAADDEETRDYITLESPVVDAPSIGPKTASRLEKVDIWTIGDLLNADPAETAAALNVRYIKTDTLLDWQDQTRLMVEAPGLRVLDSQILVGAGIRSADDLAKASATKVLKAATGFLDTPKGARVLWGGENNVDKNEVEHWIGLAKSAQG
ncbi:MAG: DUF4332 domain-containing protein [Hyphomonadaceae bacterium]|nr:DUF4332 domain-containing protein [Hyphomonadaceae bacterium]